MEHSRDDGFSNLQLTQKQTVFLTVALMVVVSVAFIAGVLVGRDVKGSVPPGLYRETAVMDAPLPDDLPPPPPVQAGNSESPEGIVKETVTYPDRLTQAVPAAESLSETPGVRNEELPTDAAPAGSASAAGATATGVPLRRDPAGTTAAPLASAAMAFAEPEGPGMAVQVSAYRNRREAEAMAGRLTSKGYTAYVMAPVPGAPNLFRVRVGKFTSREDADRVVTRLKREERLEPWIVR